MRDEIEDASVSLEEKKETFERMNEDVRSLSESLDYQEGRLNMLRSVLQSCASRQNSMGMSNTCVSETMEYDMVANEYRSSVDRHNRLIDDRDDVISSHDAMVVEINDQIDDFNRACKTE